MTDHAARSRALMAAGYATDAKTEALLAIASAIRDSTPEPTQADTPDQYKPGGVVLSATEHQTLLARAEKAEAERDCWQQRAREAEAAQDLLAEERDEWRARAENADQGWDAILSDLRRAVDEAKAEGNRYRGVAPLAVAAYRDVSDWLARILEHGARTHRKDQPND